MKGRGAPLPSSLRAFFEPRLGHDFGRVRIHTDAEAAETTSALGAAAFTVRDDVAFAPGRFEPDTPTGRRLIAHELVHVVQQSTGPARIARASYGVVAPNPRGVRGDLVERSDWIPPEEQVAPAPVPELSSEETAPEREVLVVQRQPPDAGGAPDAGPQLAAPTLALAPGANVTRGDNLTVSVNFAPASGETLTVTGWRYETPAHGNVARPAADADFQTRWSGVMAVSGELVFTYRVTPTGPNPPAGSPQTIRSPVAVNDRTGSQWVSVVTEQPEASLAGQPSPPRQFRQLGLHSTVAPALPTPTTTLIANGPNAQRTYVSSLTAGTFTALARIHPDLTAATSAFRTFHLNPSRLYFVVGTTKNLIPLADYSGLTVAAGTVSFTVPNWEAFYKKHNFYRVTATANGAPIVVRQAWWRLAANAEDADIRITNPAAVRAALGIPSTEGYTFTATPRGTWEGYQLMQAPAILAGTRSHEYAHATHSHRANFLKMMRALDPQRKIESVVAAPGHPVNFADRISGLWTEINRPDHELVDEAASRRQEAFVPVAGATMAEINTDPATGAFLGSVWSITDDRQMT